MNLYSKNECFILNHKILFYPVDFLAQVKEFSGLPKSVKNPVTPLDETKNKILRLAGSGST